MRLLIDTNILLDVLQNRKPHSHTSSLIWKLCEIGLTEGYVSSLTFANLVYVMRKELNPDKIEIILKQLKLIFHLTDLNVCDITRAAEMKWDDFEDALQCAIAEKIHADFIITRNVKDFKQSMITAVTPSEYLLKM